MKILISLLLFFSLPVFSCGWLWQAGGFTSYDACYGAAWPGISGGGDYKCEESSTPGIFSMYQCQGGGEPPECQGAATEWDSTTGECTGTGEDENCYDTIMANGGNGSFSCDASGCTCTIGDPDNNCTLSGSGACYDQPDDNGECQSGYAYGTVNGQGICIAQENGAGGPNMYDYADGDYGENVGDPQIVNETTSTSQTTSTTGNDQTETTTTTTEQTLHTTVTPDSSGFIDCGDGQFAINLANCDSSTTCAAGYYIFYGNCLPMPAIVDREIVENTTQTTTTVDNVTGESQTTSSTSSSNTPVATASGGSSSEKVTIEFEGPCDPSMANYYDCLEVQTTMPEHTVTDNADYQSVFDGYYSRIENAPITQAMYAVTNVVPQGQGTCTLLVIDLTDTLIGQELSTDMHCQLAEAIRIVMSVVMSIFWCFIGVKLFGEA